MGHSQSQNHGCSTWRGILGLSLCNTVKEGRKYLGSFQNYLCQNCDDLVLNLILFLVPFGAPKQKLSFDHIGCNIGFAL